MYVQDNYNWTTVQRSWNLWTAPEYHISVGLNYSDFYGYLNVERSVYRELHLEFAEKASIMAGIEVNGDINKTLSSRTGVVY